MTIRVRFRREAEADVLDGLAWYRERGLEMGEAFLRSLDACPVTIPCLPENHPVVSRDIRRALLS